MRGEEGECTSRGLYEGEFFPGVGKILYEGPESTNPLSFHYYNADEVIMGKPMKEWWVALKHVAQPHQLLAHVNILCKLSWWHKLCMT